MACLICTFGTGKGIAAFPTERSFIEFRSAIGALFEQGKITKIEVASVGPFWRDHYRCAACGEQWVLTAPDQAFRGGYTVSAVVESATVGDGHVRPNTSLERTRER